VPPRALNERLLERGILGGVELGRWYPALDDSVLFCCTEMNSSQQIDALAQALDDLGRPTAPAPREERRGR
jgi:glycine dehydrogenase subunit 1